MAIFVILTIFLLVIFAILITLIEIRVEIVCQPNLSFYLHIYLWRKIKVFTLSDKRKRKKKVKKKRKKKKKSAKKIGLFKFLPKFVSKLKYVNITEFELNGRIGTNDAATTALASGIFYTVSGWLQTFLNQIFTLKSFRLNYQPLYSKSEFFVSFFCIANVRIANIINALVYLCVLVAKNKWKEVRK
jgi:hypothetical protein